jgi:hypothetical protein
MNLLQPAWARFYDTLPEKAVDFVRTKFDSHGSFATNVNEVSEKSSCSLEQAKALLEKLAADGCLNVQERFRCSFCDRDLTKEQTEESECPYCHGVFGGNEPGVQQYKVYVRTGYRTRDVKWVVTIHGMNTQGSWQEQYAWRLAKVYGYSVPTAIYKYGDIKISPFIPWRRTYYVSRLAESLRRYSAETLDSGYGDRPDVITHSLGTWLLYKALQNDKNIKVGRVILTGSIIPPDFDWKLLTDTGQVEAILCHHAGKDIVVRLAQYGISDSGPSGYRGFNNRQTVCHRYEPTFAHSDFFSPNNLPSVMENTWGPFLTCQQSELCDFSDKDFVPRKEPWHPSRLRFITRFLKNIIIILLFLLFGSLLFCALVGIRDVWRWL